jgi:hypothetical protein
VSNGHENEVAKAAIKQALEEHFSLMRAAITRSRYHTPMAVDDYIRALRRTGADKRLEWAVRAEMTSDVSRPRPPTAEEVQRESEEAEKRRREDPMQHLTLLEKQSLAGEQKRLGRSLTSEERRATLEGVRRRRLEAYGRVHRRGR